MGRTYGIVAVSLSTRASNASSTIVGVGISDVLHAVEVKPSLRKHLYLSAFYLQACSLYHRSLSCRESAGGGSRSGLASCSTPLILHSLLVRLLACLLGCTSTRPPNERSSPNDRSISNVFTPSQHTAVGYGTSYFVVFEKRPYR